MQVQEVRYTGSNLKYLLVVLDGSTTRASLEAMQPDMAAMTKGFANKDVHAVVVTAHGGVCGVGLQRGGICMEVHCRCMERCGAGRRVVGGVVTHSLQQTWVNLGNVFFLTIEIAAAQHKSLGG